MSGTIVSLSLSPVHGFSKETRDRLTLIAGEGVAGDAHCGVKVKHRSRVRQNPDQPNLRQVHLIHAELFAELAGQGFDVSPGDIGENVLTRGIDLLGLPRGARLRLGDAAIVEITGLRNPCSQLDDFRPGLMKALLGRDAEGGLVRKSGVMGIVIAGGEIASGDPIMVELPSGPHEKLDRV